MGSVLEGDGLGDRDLAEEKKKRERKAEDFMMESLALDVRGELSCRTEADA